MEYNRKLMDAMADNLEAYLNVIESYVIIEGLTKEEYEHAVKKVKKLVKHLRAGDGDKVFDKEKYIEMVESGKFGDLLGD
jgi:uncharacterized protein YheU (UPF0270 family)